MAISLILGNERATKIGVMAAVALALMTGFARAQNPPAFTPIVLDAAKVQELFNDVPMIDPTRAALVRKIDSWEKEAVREAAARKPQSQGEK